LMYQQQPFFRFNKHHGVLMFICYINNVPSVTLCQWISLRFFGIAWMNCKSLSGRMNASGFMKKPCRAQQTMKEQVKISLVWSKLELLHFRRVDNN
jgi:hypothetical protein